MKQLLRICIGWFPMMFLMFLPPMLFGLPMSLYMNLHEDSGWWAVLPPIACLLTWLLYSISETYKKFADYVWGLSSKIWDWMEE